MIDTDERGVVAGIEKGGFGFGHNSNEGVLGHVHSQSGGHLGVDPALFQDQVDPARDPTFAGGEEAGGFSRNQFLLESIQNALIEGHPAEGGAGLDDLVETAVVTFAQSNGFLGAQVVAQNFHEQLATAADFGSEPLAYDVAHGVGKADAYLLFLA